MDVRPLKAADRDAWLALREELWPDYTASQLDSDVDGFFAGSVKWGVFVAEVEGRLIGFIECSLRDSAPGCNSSPVAYVEGWYVQAPHRSSGIGRELMDRGEAWGRECGCTEMASDTTSDYPLSPAAHQALGFRETKVSIHYQKRLASSQE